MTNDNLVPWVLQYRASVGDSPTPTLDKAILAAAGRHLANRRTTRHVGASLIVACAMIAISTVWLSRPGPDSHPAITEFGRFEGVSRRYLLEVETEHFTGFGIAEGSP